MKILFANDKFSLDPKMFRFYRSSKPCWRSNFVALKHNWSLYRSLDLTKAPSSILDFSAGKMILMLTLLLFSSICARYEPILKSPCVYNSDGCLCFYWKIDRVFHISVYWRFGAFQFSSFKMMITCRLKFLSLKLDTAVYRPLLSLIRLILAGTVSDSCLESDIWEER